MKNQFQLEEKLEANFQSLEDKLSQKIRNYNNIEAKLQDYHKTVLGTCDPAEENLHTRGLSHSPISDDSVTNLALSLTSEQKEKKKRQFNIIVHNLKESDASDSTARKQEDIESYCSLFSTYLNVTASIKTAIHLGKKDSKPCCLLKLTLGSLDDKTEILKHKM